MISPRPLLWLAAPVIASTAMVSCNDGSKAAAERARQELSDKETEVEELKSQLGKLKTEVEAGKKAGEKADATLKELEKAREENETLKDEAEELRKANEKLQDEVTAKVRHRAIGEKHERIASPSGKVYRQVVIRKVDDAGVSFGHEAGASTLDEKSAPAAWVQRFRLGVRPPEAPPALAAADAAPAPAALPKGGGKTDKHAVVRSKLPGVLFIGSEKTKGSAFIATRDGTTWLYTAAHVLTQGKGLTVKNADGATLTEFGKCEVATDCDLARIEVSVKEGLALSVVKPGTVTTGQEIVAVGNSGGSDVLTLLNGKVVALGPKEVEVSASVIGGNSGGPVMIQETGEVVGVVCRAEAPREDVWSAGTDFSQVRRFASRIDREVPWRAASLDSLRTENQRISTFDSRTRLVFAMAALEPGQNGLRLDMQVAGGKGPTVMSIFAEHKDVAPVQRLIQMNKQLAEKQLRSSERDLKKRFAGFYQDVLNLVGNDTSNFTPEHFSYVNRKEAELSLKWRNEATKLLTAAANALGR
ncbi:trypsin-like peptidase domain-containing protein [Luteolibacter arcticus]|uniref:Trypsin-like peptidase domain-containing protein n=1 Tax=Luteolibacter arcticus TaxID=1581411 RepID=A0ABT3GJF2_9BACT|nr:trypsin-like peptidase domain-containing protein [Luteolibacter arcticus]MCW1923639.1 trypsin-like peptidase domain-containing protein [Luteolibacter arcticus]